MASRVFIISDDQRFNTESAKKFGEIKTISVKKISPFNTKKVLSSIHREIFRIGFTPEEDYVAFTGPSIFLALFVSYMISRYTRIRTLMFDARRNQYIERIVDVSDIEISEEVNS